MKTIKEYKAKIELLQADIDRCRAKIEEIENAEIQVGDIVDIGNVGGVYPNYVKMLFKIVGNNYEGEKAISIVSRFEYGKEEPSAFFSYKVLAIDNHPDLNSTQVALIQNTVDYRVYMITLDCLDKI